LHEARGSTARVGNTAPLRQIYFWRSAISMYDVLVWVHLAFFAPTK
jgi:hypothetical protein